MIIKTIFSPNCSEKTRKNKEIKFIILHYTGMQSEIVSLKRLLNSKYKVSCHYLINRKGSVIKLVNENRVAWHAGKSRWKNYRNLNKNSIGIELVNKGHNFGYQKFTNLQIKNLTKLCLRLKKKYSIKTCNILGHSDIAPLRKKDPGELFPWDIMSQKGLALKLQKSPIYTSKTDTKRSRKFFFRNLYKIGYRYFNKNKKSKKDKFIIKAFQRRFLPKNLTGKIDQKTYKISHFLAKLKKI
tara:strand:+ start:16 stop:738 length:723 start_codon:yes stop_codon:yes gene_type:complete